MEKDMGQGVTKIVIEYDEPLIITSRFDEGIMAPENFSVPEQAINDDYPKGAYAYT